VIPEVGVRPFERLQFLRGTENLFIDITYCTNNFYKLLENLNNYYTEDMKSWCKTGDDAVWRMDDWGANKTLLIDSIYKILNQILEELNYLCNISILFRNQ